MLNWPDGEQHERYIGLLTSGSWQPLIHCFANGFKPENVITTSGGDISIPAGLVPNNLQKIDAEEFTGEFCFPSIWHGQWEAWSYRLVPLAKPSSSWSNRNMTALSNIMDALHLQLV